MNKLNNIPLRFLYSKLPIPRLRFLPLFALIILLCFSLLAVFFQTHTQFTLSLSIVNTVAHFFNGLIHPLTFIAEPSRRIFWGFLISSAILVLIVLKLQNKPLKWRYLKHIFFSKKYWLHKSTQTDILFLFFNSMLRGGLLIPLVGSQLLGALWLAKTFQIHLGNAPDLHLPWWCIATCFTLAFFILEDLSRFSLHRAMHKIPFLWHFHKTHHSAVILSPLTLFRVHPIEMMLYFFRSIFVFSAVAGVFIYLFQGQLSGFDILGVDALGFLFNAIGANLRHSHIWMSFGKFEKWFISPAQHQIHHSRAIEHRNKNFGTCLAIWDKIFKTHTLALEIENKNKKTITFGL